MVRLGCREILHMAGHALCRQPLELADCRSLVTLIAAEHGVRAHQRKAVLMVIDGLHRGVPASHVVTRLALLSQLALVNIRVAVRALIPNVRKDHTDMA